jgi:serine/threonine-protein kinase
MDAVLRGLESAHELGVVHRDLSPENIFIRDVRGGGRQIKLLDFGLAGVLPEIPDPKLKGELSTATGTLLGTPGYASPEALVGKKLDARADVYSAGVVLFELLTGLGPFDVDEVGVPAPSLHADGLPSGLDEIVACATSIERDERFQRAPAFRLALASVRDKLEVR